jgi:Flagellar assembly protein FliH
MSLSNERARPKSLRFVDVSAEGRTPGWLSKRNDEPYRTGPGERVDRLVPPEIPSHERPPLAPVLDSVRPPPPRPSQFPGSQYPSSPPGPASQYPGTLEGSSLEPFTLGAAPEPRFDTLVEDLVPRAEEEAAAAIITAVDRFQRDRHQALAAAEQDLVDLCQAVCRRVLLAELTHNPLLVERLVHAGLEALAGGDKLTVRLGPFFADAAQTIKDSLEQRGVHAIVVVDPSIGMHGCQLATELGRVDESVTQRLEVLLASLGLSDVAGPRPHQG